MAAQARFSECVERGSINQRAKDRSFEALMETMGELKKMLADITARLPIPTTPLYTREMGNSSNPAAGKVTLDPDPPDLIGSGNAMMGGAMIVSEPPTHDEIPTTKLVAMEETSDLDARRLFDELPKSASINDSDLIEQDGLERVESMVAKGFQRPFVYQMLDDMLEPHQDLKRVGSNAIESAQQLFDEMPKPLLSYKTESSLQIAEEVHGLKVAEVNSLDNATLLLLVKNDFTHKLMLPHGSCYSTDYMRAVCFDPGGLSMPHVVYSLTLDLRDLWFVNDTWYDMTNLFEALLSGIVLRDCDRCILELDKNKVNSRLQKVYCGETFAFDPGGVAVALAPYAAHLIPRGFRITSVDKSESCSGNCGTFVVNLHTDKIPFYPGGSLHLGYSFWFPSTVGNFLLGTSVDAYDRVGIIIGEEYDCVTYLSKGNESAGWFSLVSHQLLLHILEIIEKMPFHLGGIKLISQYSGSAYCLVECSVIEDFYAGNCSDFIEVNASLEAYELGIDSPLAEIFLLRLNLLFDTSESREIEMLYPGSVVVIDMERINLCGHGCAIQYKTYAVTTGFVKNSRRFLGCKRRDDVVFTPLGESMWIAMLLCDVLLHKWQRTDSTLTAESAVEWFNTCFDFGWLHMTGAVIDHATTVEIIGLNKGWKSVIKSTLMLWKEFDGMILWKAFMESKKNAPYSIISGEIILFTLPSYHMNIAFEMGQASQLTLMLICSNFQAQPHITGAVNFQIKATDLDTTFLICEDEDNLVTLSDDLATFSMVGRGFKGLIYDPGGEEMLWGAASFCSYCIGVVPSAKMNMAVASSLPSLLGNLATGAMTTAVILELVAWQFGFRLTFDPGGGCPRFIKIWKLIESILEDKDPLKRGVLMQDYSYFPFYYLNPVHPVCIFHLFQLGLFRFRLTFFVLEPFGGIFPDYQD